MDKNNAKQYNGPMFFGSAARLGRYAVADVLQRMPLRANTHEAKQRLHRTVRMAFASTCMVFVSCLIATIVTSSTTYGSSIITSPDPAVASIFKLQPIPQAAPLPAKPVARVVKPTAPPALPGCEKGSVMNIVAHEDDDILFMNPAIQQQLDAGMCMQTIYLTAGDAGLGSAYWTERELGPDAAYATMAGSPDSWQPTSVAIAGHALAARTLPDNPRLTLIFLRLPDGNLGGQGFAATEYGSIHKLQTGEISTIKSVDGLNEYSDQELVGVLRGLMHAYRPSIINTQAYNEGLVANGDHSDHQTAGYYTDQAAKAYYSGTQPHHYLGYQLGGMPNNLTDSQLGDKQTIFEAYAARDNVICPTDRCTNGTGYEQYYGKQYEQPTLPN